ncbi:restriction endonuclease subunit S [Streptomyces thermolineatus]|uniref:Restriction endonuclease subunit S n=1 Tax=Streptomyces thermolineatus TaxID=44033 RepID=A0ABN3KSG5_9ACTN
MAEKLTIAQLVAQNALSFGDGYRTKKSEHGLPGIPILRVAEVQNGYISPDFTDHVSSSFRGAMGGKTSQPGDIILTTKGTVGRVAIMPDDAPEFIYSPQVCYFRVNKNGPLSGRFLYYWFKSPEFWRQAGSRKSQTDMADYLNMADIKSLSITLPRRDEQDAIVDVLGALDDKIAVNERIAATTRRLGLALFAHAVLAEGSFDVSLESASSVLTRGIAPKYSESPDDLVALNQKCIRAGRVNTTPARLTIREKVKSPKLLQRNDALVNSTGFGTLGRVALWNSDDPATVDSHITIVRFDEAQVDPVCAGFAMLLAQPQIEAMGEGSTGQTELRRAQLGGLEIKLPSKDQQQQLRPKLDTLEERAAQALTESRTLATLRDTLLPQLMSGRLRVKDAEKIVEDNT